MAFLLLAGTAGVRAQQCDVPQIGAQVFVEPGQTPEDIDGFFRLLHDNGTVSYTHLTLPTILLV